jgi:hypothetical protein
LKYQSDEDKLLGNVINELALCVAGYATVAPKYFLLQAGIEEKDCPESYPSIHPLDRKPFLQQNYINPKSRTKEDGTELSREEAYALADDDFCQKVGTSRLGINTNFVYGNGDTNNK